MKKNMISKIALLAGLAVLLTGVLFLSISEIRGREMHKMPAGLREFSVYDPIPSCARWQDHMPKTRKIETYRTYLSARQRWRSKVEWQLTKAEAQAILHDVQETAAAGDWGARALLAHFYRHGLGPLPKNNVLAPNAFKAVEIARQAAAAGQAWGFYDIGVAHEHGYGGAQLDDRIAWAYYLRAAELGSPDAQMALADAYGRAGRGIDEEAMLQCAFAQGHGPASYRMALRQEIRGDLLDATRLFQEGTKFGSRDCASSLIILFSNGYLTSDKQSQKLKSLGLVADEERARRYQIIADALEVNPDLRFPKLDTIIPLPPEELPVWNEVTGTLLDDLVRSPSY